MWIVNFDKKTSVSASEICTEVAEDEVLFPEADRGHDLVRGVRGAGAEVPLPHVQDILVSVTKLELHFPTEYFSRHVDWQLNFTF